MKFGLRKSIYYARGWVLTAGAVYAIMEGASFAREVSKIRGIRESSGVESAVEYAQSWVDERPWYKHIGTFSIRQFARKYVERNKADTKI